MNADANAGSGAGVLFGLTVVTAGAGTLLLGLFPFALPFLLLLGLLLTPLLPLAVAVALVAMFARRSGRSKRTPPSVRPREPQRVFRHVVQDHLA
jgi:hypothetical protein